LWGSESLWASKREYSTINSYYFFNNKNWIVDFYIKSLLTIDRDLQKFFKVDWLKNFINRIRKNYNIDPKFLSYVALTNYSNFNNIYDFNKKLNEYIKTHKTEFLNIDWSKTIKIDWKTVVVLPFMKNPYYQVKKDVPYYWIKYNWKFYWLTWNSENWYFTQFYDKNWNKNTIKFYDLNYYLANWIYWDINISDVNDNNYSKTLTNWYQLNLNKWVYYLTFFNIKNVIDWFEHITTENFLDGFNIKYWFTLQNESENELNNSNYLYVLNSFNWYLTKDFLSYYTNSSLNDLTKIVENYYQTHWVNPYVIWTWVDYTNKVINRIEDNVFYWAYHTVWWIWWIKKNLPYYLQIVEKYWKINYNYTYNWIADKSIILDNIWAWRNNVDRLFDNLYKRSLFNFQLSWYLTEDAWLNHNYKYFDDQIYYLSWWKLTNLFSYEYNWDENTYENDKIKYVLWKKESFDNYIKANDYIKNWDLSNYFDFTTWINDWWFNDKYIWSLWQDFRKLYWINKSQYTVNEIQIIDDSTNWDITSDWLFYSLWLTSQEYFNTWNYLKNLEIKWNNKYIGNINWDNKIFSNWLWFWNRLLSWNAYYNLYYYDSLTNSYKEKKLNKTVWYIENPYSTNNVPTDMWLLTYSDNKFVLSWYNLTSIWTYVLWDLVNNKLNQQSTYIVNQIENNNDRQNFTVKISVPNLKTKNTFMINLPSILRAKNYKKDVNNSYLWIYIKDKYIIKNWDWSNVYVNWSSLYKTWVYIIWDDKILLWNNLTKQFDKIDKKTEKYTYESFSNNDLKQILINYFLENVILKWEYNYELTWVYNEIYSWTEIIWYYVDYDLIYQIFWDNLYIWIWLKQKNNKDVDLVFWFLIKNDWEINYFKPKFLKLDYGKLDKKNLSIFDTNYYLNWYFYNVELKNVYETNSFLTKNFENSYIFKKWEIKYIYFDEDDFKGAWNYYQVKNKTYIWDKYVVYDVWFDDSLKGYSELVNNFWNKDINAILWNLIWNDTFWMQNPTLITDLINSYKLNWETKYIIWMNWSINSWSISTIAFAYKKFQYPAVWLLLEENEYNSLQNWYKLINKIFGSKDYWVLNTIVEPDISDKNKFVLDLLNKYWIRYSSNANLLEINYNLYSDNSSIDNIKWSLLTYKFRLFNTKNVKLSNWELLFNINKEDKYLNLIQLSLNCNWKKITPTLIKIWWKENYKIDLNWLNLNDKCELNLSIKLDTNLDDNELSNFINWLILNFYLKNLISENWFKIKNKEYHLKLWWTFDSVILNLNSLNVSTCKAYLYDENWNLTTNFNWKLTKVNWFVQYNAASKLCWAKWCKQLIWVKIHLNLNWWWKFLNTNFTKTIEKWLNDYFNWIFSNLNSFEKKLFNNLSQQQINDNSQVIFIPFNLYWINNLWRNTFSIIPKDNDLTKFTFNLSYSCEFIYWENETQYVNWWTLSYKYYLNKKEDLWHLKIFNPDDNDNTL